MGSTLDMYLSTSTSIHGWSIWPSATRAHEFVQRCQSSEGLMQHYYPSSSKQGRCSIPTFGNKSCFPTDILYAIYSKVYCIILKGSYCLKLNINVFCIMKNEQISHFLNDGKLG